MQSVEHRQFCRVCEAYDSLPYDEHVMIKQHQVCVHRHELSLYRTAHSIFINNLPNDTPKEEILAYFATFGTILSSKITPNVYGIIEYKEAQVVADLLKAKKVNLNGKIIMVRPRDPKPEKKYVNEDDPRVNPDEIVQLLRSQSDIISEILTLQRYLQPISRDVFYAALCMDLKGVLAQYMHCMVYPFGSTVTGLDFSTSDVDAYVYVDPTDRICGRLSGDALAKRLVQLIPPFLTNSRLFAKVLSIPNANTPIVKCVHIQTGIECDINFKNMLGVCNSYLTKKYLSYNRRFTITLLIIKYWAKVHNFTGVGKFSNYSITVLFLYCFMQEPYNLPTIFQLQCSSEHVSNIQAGWESGIDFGDYVMSDDLAKLAIPDLLFAFFKFYSNLNYADVVICPFIGRALDRSVFLEGGVLPREYDKYKVRLSKDCLYPTTPICVQDVFELCRNVTRPVRVQDLDEFVEMCKEGLSLLNPQLHDNLRHLYPIFYNSWYTDDDSFQLCLSETQKLKTHLNKQKSNSLNTRDLFHNFVRDFVTRTLTGIYLLDISIETSETISSSPPIKLQKKNKPTVMHDFNIVYDCAAYVDVWTSRSIIIKDFSKEADESMFDAEIRLSGYIASTICKNIKSKTPLLKLKIELREGSESEKHVKLILTHDGGKGFAFKDFGTLFVKYVRSLYSRYVTSLIDRTDEVNDVNEKKK